MVITNKVAATVQVCRDGVWETLPEYRVERNDRKTTCYVASEEGLQFRVQWQDKRQRDGRFGTWLFCSVDGQITNRRAIYEHTGVPREIISLTGFPMDSYTEMPFEFAKLITTDDADQANMTESAVKYVGSIEVKFGRAMLSDTQLALKQPQVPAKFTFLETVKKAKIPHSVAYGAAIPRSTRPVKTTYIDPIAEPEMVFEFKYRSELLLETQGIKPRPRDDSATPQNNAAVTEITDSPEPEANASQPRKKREAGVVIDIDDDDDKPSAEITRLRAEVDRLRKRVKLEEGGTAERPVKLENGCASAGQIIDLVSDDES